MESYLQILLLFGSVISMHTCIYQYVHVYMHMIVDATYLSLILLGDFTHTLFRTLQMFFASRAFSYVFPLSGAHGKAHHPALRRAKSSILREKSGSRSSL